MCVCVYIYICCAFVGVDNKLSMLFKITQIFGYSEMLIVYKHRN